MKQMAKILAGVTIAMLSGNNSAPQKATEAAQKDAIAGAKDEIAMEVQEALLNYYNNTYVKGNVTKGASTQSVVREAAERAVSNAKSRNKQLLDSSTVDGNTITLKTKSYTVTGTIDENRGITWSDYVASTGETGETLTNAEKKEKINDVIGQTVDYGKDITSYREGWRVFYASEDEMFLISTDIVGEQELKIDGYTNSDDVFNPKSGNGTNYSYSDVAYGAKYNEKWKTKLGGTTDTSEKSRAIAYLCDPKNWTEYISQTAPKGTYAVGGPTMELLALSWEASGHQTKWSENLDDDVGIYGFQLNKPEGLCIGRPMSYDVLSGLYNPGKEYWLASPIADGSDVVGIVGYGKIGDGCYDSSIGVRTIVSIPISKVQIKEDGTVKIE